jgi:hypoxanthine phosphoribosyltransferase
MNLHEKAKPQCLFSAEQLQARIQTLGQEIAQDYDGKPLLLIGMLKGASVFLSDLIRAVPIPVAIDFMRLQSYGAGTISSGQVTCLLEPSMPLQQYHVLLVEDILDTGRTLQTALQWHRGF